MQSGLHNFNSGGVSQVHIQVRILLSKEGHKLCSDGCLVTTSGDELQCLIQSNVSALLQDQTARPASLLILHLNNLWPYCLPTLQDLNMLCVFWQVLAGTESHR